MISHFASAFLTEKFVRVKSYCALSRGHVPPVVVGDTASASALVTVDMGCAVLFGRRRRARHGGAESR